MAYEKRYTVHNIYIYIYICIYILDDIVIITSVINFYRAIYKIGWLSQLGFVIYELKSREVRHGNVGSGYVV